MIAIYDHTPSFSQFLLNLIRSMPPRASISARSSGLRSPVVSTVIRI